MRSRRSHCFCYPNEHNKLNSHCAVAVFLLFGGEDVRAVRIEVAAELIKQALHLPSDTEIIHIGEYNLLSRSVSIVIAGPEFEEVAEDEEIPKANATVIKEEYRWKFEVD